jgi:aryl-alcohol dehydrogenase-like predicted oxidoreductase
MPAWEIVDSLWIAKENSLSPWVASQDEYSLLARDAERERIPALKAKGGEPASLFPARVGHAHRQIQSR